MTPRRTIFACTVAAVALSACGVTPDPDLVASVEGNELSQDEFDAYADELLGDDAATSIDGNTGRQIVGTFVGIEVLKADMTSMGVDPLESAGEVEGLTRLQNDFQFLVQEWGALPVATTLDDTVIELYEQGSETTGIVCAAHILVDSEEDADVVREELESGAEFGELALEMSNDPGSAANGGNLGCYPVAQFESQFIPEFVDASLEAEIGVPTDPVESEFGWHVIQLTPADQLPPEVVVQLRLQTFDDRYDIEINPRYGQWDASAIVVPTT